MHVCNSPYSVDMKGRNYEYAAPTPYSLILSAIPNPVKSALPHEGNLKGMDAPLVVIHESAANEFQNRKHFQTCSSTSIATIVLANNSSTLPFGLCSMDALEGLLTGDLAAGQLTLPVSDMELSSYSLHHIFAMHNYYVQV